VVVAGAVDTADPDTKRARVEEARGWSIIGCNTSVKSSRMTPVWLNKENTAVGNFHLSANVALNRFSGIQTQL
jgi:hypothetical protein